MMRTESTEKRASRQAQRSAAARGGSSHFIWMEHLPARRC